MFRNRALTFIMEKLLKIISVEFETKPHRGIVVHGGKHGNLHEKACKLCMTLYASLPS